MRGTFTSCLCAVVALCAPAVALAAATNIDDSATLVVSPTIQMHWPAISQRRAKRAVLTGSSTVRVRLNVAPWVGRAGRVFLVLPAQAPGLISAIWTTQGALLPGEVSSGGRTLVYSGRITTRQLEDVLELTLTVGGEMPQPIYRLDFQFEMETF